MTNLVKVWDLPTRLFHAALVFLIVAAFVTVKLGDDLMRLHAQIGLSILSLIVFRLCWGFFGGHWSQFKHFTLHPRHVIAYLKENSFNSQSYPGHNPLGSWSSILMIFALAIQALSGLCSDDEILFNGPLTPYLNSTQIEWASFYHSEVGQILLITLVATHIFAIVFYKFKLKQDLITPMLSGNKISVASFTPSKDNLKTRWFALAIFLLIVSVLFHFLPI
jgi:cytochrome b